MVCGVDRFYTMIPMRAALLPKPFVIVLVLVLIAYIMMGVRWSYVSKTMWNLRTFIQVHGGFFGFTRDLNQ